MFVCKGFMKVIQICRAAKQEVSLAARKVKKIKLLQRHWYTRVIM